MATVEIFRTLFDYNDALYRRIWDSIMQLTDEQFVQAVDYSHGSLRNQIVHVAVVDARWLRGLQERPDAQQFTLDPVDYPTRAGARALWDSTAQEVMDYIAGLDEASLAGHPRGMPGPVKSITGKSKF